MLVVVIGEVVDVVDVVVPVVDVVVEEGAPASQFFSVINTYSCTSSLY